LRNWIRQAQANRCERGTANAASAAIVRGNDLNLRPLDPQKMAVTHFHRSRAVCGRLVGVHGVHLRAGRSPARTTCGPSVVPKNPTNLEHPPLMPCTAPSL
jgi:hypothetical protein